MSDTSKYVHIIEFYSHRPLEKGFTGRKEVFHTKEEFDTYVSTHKCEFIGEPMVFHPPHK